MTNLATVLTCLDNKDFKSYVNQTSSYMFFILNDHIINYTKDYLSNSDIAKTFFVTKNNDKVNDILDKSIIVNENNLIEKLLNENYDDIILINKCLPLLTSKTINKLLKTHQDKQFDISYFDGFYIFSKSIFINKYLNSDLLNINIVDSLKSNKIKINNKESLIVYNRKTLAKANGLMQDRINNYWLENGVSIESPKLTFIGKNVKIGNDSIIYPNTYIYGNTMLGTNSKIGPNAYIIDSFIDNDYCLANCIINKQKLLKK